MGVFDSIKSLIFGKAEAAPAPEAAAEAAPAPVAEAAAAPAPAAPAAPAAVVDVAAILDQAVAASGQKLDWKHSIVDLLKALKLDSSLSSRKELAKELGYTGSTDDSAAMNIWLHKVVIRKLAENGGKVPADLLD
ncbi:DUF3597 domain-containing protein [Zavarzinia compransoris]|uniref:DUF3597 domain-containing protein n=1 Tax=Zavarzinia compransoris TaxID=1264899 RepID=A0A317DW11_9PROT|nr:DUF3597 domain-containing protein [Zavarzinia compransoris]PWR18878.1 hypothetical protein DKG75_18060 [Zavarzinia compransoris]TDP48873.1 uncharacterized protein DUF3597 [Zavarzinia compransoris]